MLEHIFATQICSIYGAGKAQTTRVAAVRAARHRPPPCPLVPEPTSSRRGAAEPARRRQPGRPRRALVQDGLLEARHTRQQGLRARRCDQPVGVCAAAILAQGGVRAGQPAVHGAPVGTPRVQHAHPRLLQGTPRRDRSTHRPLSAPSCMLPSDACSPRRAERSGLRRRARQAAPRWDAARGRKAAAGLGRRVGPDGLAAKLIPAERRHRARQGRLACRC